jgi:hypothetical protein
MGAVMYILCALVALMCCVLLLRAYARSRMRLLLWSGLCFLGLTLSNLLVFVDLKMLPQIDLYLWRLITATVAMLILLFGLIWEGGR